MSPLLLTCLVCMVSLHPILCVYLPVPTELIENLEQSSNNQTKIHPLSELLQFRDNTTVSFHNFPVGPDCSQILDIEEEQYPATVTIWKINPDVKSDTAVIFWMEKIFTRCSLGFFGSYYQGVIERRRIENDFYPTQEQIENAFAKPIGLIVEVDDIPESQRYNCKWCISDNSGDYNMHYSQKVYFSRYPDGSVRSPPGAWVQYDEKSLKDSMRNLFIRVSESVKSCPLAVSEIRGGVLSKAGGGNTIVSLPSVNLQFSLSPQRPGITCVFGSTVYQIEHSLGGYLISVDSGNYDWRNNSIVSRSKRSYHQGLDKVTRRYKQFVFGSSRVRRSTSYWEFFSYLKTSVDYAQLRFEQNFIIKQINHNLRLLQKTICDSVFDKWLHLYPPDLPRKIARFLTGSLYTTADYHNGVYRVQETAPTSVSVELIIPINISYGMFEVKIKARNSTLWAEPVTGLLFEEPHWTHFSLSAAWLPGKNGTGIDPISGKISLPEVSTDQLVMIKQSEAYAGKALYSSSELASAYDESDSYRSTSASEQVESEFTVWWMPYMINGGISLVAGIAIIILTPAVLKLLSKCISRGERSLEEVLHLTDSPHSREETKSWG